MSINFIQKTFASLRHKNFRMFFMGQSVSLIGSWMQMTAMSWLIYEMTGSKFLLGLIGALATLPMLFFSIYGGILADRYSKRRILLITQSLSMIFAFILAFLVFFNLIQIWHIIVISMVVGVAFAIDMPVRQSFYIEIAGKRDLMNAIALNSSMINFARIIGPTLAGITMVKLGVSWCFMLNAVSFLAVIYALYRMVVPEIKHQIEEKSLLEETLSGFRYVRNNRLILDLIILMVVVGIFGWSFGVLFPAIAKDIFHVGGRGYSILLSANGLGALFGALFIAYLGNNPKKREFVNWGIYLFSLSVALLAFCKVYWLAVIISIFAGVGLIMYISSTTTLIQSTVSDSMRGKVMGIWTLVFGGTGPLGNLYIGVAAQYMGISKTLLISSSICFISAILLALFAQPLEKQVEVYSEAEMEKEPVKI